MKQNYAGVAQLVEHQPSKLRVAGSSLVSRSARRNGGDYKNNSKRITCAAFFVLGAGIAQLVEHQLPKLRAAGSNPVSRSAKVIADVAQLVEHILGKDEVTGSIPVISSSREVLIHGCSSIGRVAVSKTVGCGFESYHPCK